MKSVRLGENSKMISSKLLKALVDIFQFLEYIVMILLVICCNWYYCNDIIEFVNAWKRSDSTELYQYNMVKDVYCLCLRVIIFIQVYEKVSLFCFHLLMCFEKISFSIKFISFFKGKICYLKLLTILYFLINLFLSVLYH